MNEPNYESIGRCTVLARRINNKLDSLFRIRAAVLEAKTSQLMSGVLELNHSAADRIEEAAEKYRSLLQEIEALANEHNKYAKDASMEPITLRVHGVSVDATKQAEANATENT
ncbi:hypothetical protein [Enterobacter cloacae]|uniref:hypothetical protein n=1 Tax=Enterobacter cloacae TaxID=550 RepID=UPI00254FE009|nr:hypothetical protein [Enterobacter cloacae]